MLRSAAALLTRLVLGLGLGLGLGSDAHMKAHPHPSSYPKHCGATDAPEELLYLLC